MPEWKGCKTTIWPVCLIAIGVLGLQLLWNPELSLAQSGRKQVLEGNKLFEEQKYDAAFNRYRDAQLANPTSPLVEFNLGAAAYKKRNFEEAHKAFDKVLGADDPMMASKAYYNIGNTLYKEGKLPESILAYKKALELNPDDEDAKYNLEYVRTKLKEQAQEQPQSGQQQQQDQGQQGQQDQKDGSQDQQKQQQPLDQEQQDQGQQEQKAQQQEQDENQNQPASQEEGAQPQQGKKLSKEDAERILEALKNQEKDVRRVNPKRSSGRRVLKDW